MVVSKPSLVLVETEERLSALDPPRSCQLATSVAPFQEAKACEVLTAKDGVVRGYPVQS